jgi:hypothetical protein
MSHREGNSRWAIGSGRQHSSLKAEEKIFRDPRNVGEILLAPRKNAPTYFIKFKNVDYVRISHRILEEI